MNFEKLIILINLRGRKRNKKGDKIRMGFLIISVCFYLLLVTEQIRINELKNIINKDKKFKTLNKFEVKNLPPDGTFSFNVEIKKKTVI